MKTLNRKQHTVDILFVLTLFCVFALSTLAVVYIGSRVYSSTVDTMDINFNNHVTLDYISQKVHQSDIGGNIEIKDIEGLNVLCIHEVINKQSYTTYIYNDNHQVMELLINDEESFDKDNGSILMEVEALSFQVKDSLLSVSLSIHGKTHQSYISLRKGGLL